jgi:hypothetical protein
MLLYLLSGRVTVALKCTIQSLVSNLSHWGFCIAYYPSPSTFPRIVVKLITSRNLSELSPSNFLSCASRRFSLSSPGNHSSEAKSPISRPGVPNNPAGIWGVLSWLWDPNEVLNFEHKAWLNIRKPVSLDFPLLSSHRVARGELVDRLASLKVWGNGGLGTERHVHVRKV